MESVIGFVLVGGVLWWIWSKMVEGYKESFKPSKKSPSQSSARRSTKGADDAWDPINRADGTVRTRDYRIEYVDADGVITLRDISPNRTDFDEVRIRAFCFLRHDFRTFFTDRINKVWALPEGELIDLEQLHRGLKKTLVDYRAKPFGDSQADEFWETYGSACQMLAYFGKADGKFQKVEKDVVLKFLKDRGQSDDVAQAVLLRLGKETMPGEHQINCFARQLASEAQKSMRETLLVACKEVMMADGKIHADEALLLEKVEKILMG